MIGLRLEDKPHNRAIYSLLDRLKESIFWFPFPALIAFGFVIILTGHLLTDLNPRLGTVIDPLQMEAKHFPDGSIWLSLSTDGENSFVTTYDKKRFSWPSNSLVLSDLSGFIDYLKTKTAEESYRSARLQQNSAIRSKVVIAIDQNAKYLHVRPIIYALAEAGISKYGFETRLMKEK